MPFLRNCWYVAAWTNEVGDAPLGRRILNDPVVIFRGEDGQVVALSGACPHRFAPLHMGRVVDGNIQCPYHGLQFNTAGKCVFNPQGNGATPASLGLRSYPLVERYGAFWIWMGNPELADPSSLPDYGFLEDPDYAVVRGYLYCDTNYELLADNIMDLGHADFLHPTTLGNGTGTTARAKLAVTRDGNAIQCNRWMPDDVQGPLLYWLLKRETEKVDAWVDVRWEAPSNMLLTFGMTTVGSTRAEGKGFPNVHLMTPETETTSHYFWASARNFDIEDKELSEQLYAGITAAFTTEDKPMIEAQQQMMGTTDLWSLKPALLAGDAAAVMARRVLAEMIASENKADRPADRPGEVLEAPADAVAA